VIYVIIDDYEEGSAGMLVVEGPDDLKVSDLLNRRDAEREARIAAYYAANGQRPELKRPDGLTTSQYVDWLNTTYSQWMHDVLGPWEGGLHMASKEVTLAELLVQAGCKLLPFKVLQ
jgi:hypothetical protein